MHISIKRIELHLHEYYDDESQHEERGTGTYRSTNMHNVRTRSDGMLTLPANASELHQDRDDKDKHSHVSVH